MPRGAFRERLGWGTGATLACCMSAALATAVQGSVVRSVAVAFVWVGATAFLRIRAQRGLTRFVTGTIFVIANGLPAESLDVGRRVLWFLLGSAGGIVLIVAAYARRSAAETGSAPARYGAHARRATAPRRGRRRHAPARPCPAARLGRRGDHAAVTSS